MPYLRKQAISSFLRTECPRRLRLDLTPDNQKYAPERAAHGMPPRAVARPGLQVLAAAGTEWEQAKLNDLLVGTLGSGALLGTAVKLPNGTLRFDPVPLQNVLSQAAPGTFLAQVEYGVGPNFENALGIAAYRTTFTLDYADLRPDLVQVLTPGSVTEEVRPDGTISPVLPNDPRLPLRIIDIRKLTGGALRSLSGREVTYYAMTLAGWLADNNFQNFLVIPAGAVWPGSHDASALVRLDAARRAVGQRPTSAELLAALEDDLEPVPFGVFAPRLRRFFQVELQNVLQTPWQQLEWHVDNRCIGCEYLGYPWPGTTSSDPLHCWPTAHSQGHLSRVAFVSRGAQPEEHWRTTTSATSQRLHTQTASNSPAYDAHYVLRAEMTSICRCRACRVVGIQPIVRTSANRNVGRAPQVGRLAYLLSPPTLISEAA